MPNLMSLLALFSKSPQLEHIWDVCIRAVSMAPGVTHLSLDSNHRLPDLPELSSNSSCLVVICWGWFEYFSLTEFFGGFLADFLNRVMISKLTGTTMKLPITLVTTSCAENVKGPRWTFCWLASLTVLYHMALAIIVRNSSERQQDHLCTCMKK